MAIAYANLGDALYQDNQLTAAIACYRQLLHLNPNSYTAYLHTANALKSTGKLA